MRRRREDFTRLKKVVEKKKEATEREKEINAAHQQAALSTFEDDGDTLLEGYDAQEEGDVYF